MALHQVLKAFRAEGRDLQPGDIVGIGIHTLNALRGYLVGRKARERGAHVVFGGSHTTLYPEEAFEHGGATSVVKGDGDEIWSRVLDDISRGRHAEQVKIEAANERVSISAIGGT